MRLAVFIDYDNLTPSHKSAGILDVTRKALLQTLLVSPDLNGSCEVRIYGGWYERKLITELAQDVTVKIQSEFPSIIRLPKNGSTVSLSSTAELAVSMLEEPGHHIFDTFRKKKRPGNLRVLKPVAVGCTETACPLPIAIKLLKCGSCPVTSCTITADDLVHRNEQKIVDTMLTCDLIYSANMRFDQVILVSDDDDFLPPVRTLLLRGANVARFHPRPNSTRVAIRGFSSKLIDMDL